MLRLITLALYLFSLSAGAQLPKMKIPAVSERVGDLVAFGDKHTVFGDLEKTIESEQLPETYWTHGSLYEAKVPLFIYNIASPPASYFQNNFDIPRWIY